MSGEWFVLLAAFLFGATFGSFLNVCIARWPAGESVVRPRSRCPKCGRGIAWHENIPIIGWLVLSGRCRGCGLAISAAYPIVELMVALGWMAAFAAFGPTFAALRVAAFGTILLGVAITDARHYLIPDGYTVFGLFWALATAAIALFIEPVSPFATLTDALLGACVGAGIISIIGWLGEVALKKEAMGFGDVTLMAFVGAALGPGRALLTVFVGAALAIPGMAFAIALRSMRRAPAGDAQYEMALGTRAALPLVPFGVFLAPAALLTLLWGRALIDWYWQRVMTP